MKSPLFSRSIARPKHRGVSQLDRERGFTMALVAIGMISILAVAALSIDAVTLYLAREEAQRAADAAALAGVRILSLSGMTGDTSNTTNSWTPACDAATAVATEVAQQNKIAGLSLPATQITITFPNNANCGSAAIFAVNPEMTVKVTRQNLPTFFARIWGVKSSTVVASATAEAYNPSSSGNFSSGGGYIPVQPRCVKPWIVPNLDPVAGGTFVTPATGSISNPGVLQLGGGVIGEQFSLTSPCASPATDCDATDGNLKRDPTTSGGNVDYVPALVAGAATAVDSSCTTTDTYQQAIVGCDQQTQYNCGTNNGAQIDLDIAPTTPTILTGETSSAVQCVIHSGTGGQDTLPLVGGKNPVYPFQIWAGLDNPLVKNGIVNDNNPITSSVSIMSLPIYDNTAGKLTGNKQAVTIVGFLQVFMNGLDASGNPNVTVLNVSGCGTASAAAVTGTSPVPIRLITAP